jgi:hypothetical protein
VAVASFQYVNEVIDPLEPAVTAPAVRSTVEGEHTAEGFVITTVGDALIVIVTGLMSEHPAAVVPLM